MAINPPDKVAVARVRRQSWFVVRADLSGPRPWVLGLLAFVLPLVAWCAVAYVPWLWHPQMRVVDPGGVDYFEVGMLVDGEVFAEENSYAQTQGLEAATGIGANPVYFRAPDEVARALFTAFITPPVRQGDPWLHESVLHSVRVIFYGFFFSAILGVPLGILCGTFHFFSRLIEPFVDFIRYMPAPAFGVLAVAFLGIEDAPKVAIIFICTFFQMVLVVANTTRLLDTSLLEAAQTLGADRRRLLTRVIVPGILPNLYRDMRILLGWAWTYLIVAELIGASSGISWFINQQAKYRNYDNVYAAIILIGIIGLSTDQILSLLGRHLFPWQQRAGGGTSGRWLGELRRRLRLRSQENPQ